MATTKKKETAAPVTAKKPEPVMYVGPTITRSGVIQNSVYTEIPESAKAIMEQLPIFGALFMPVTTYPQAEREIREQTGYFWSAYKAAIDYINKIKGGK